MCMSNKGNTSKLLAGTPVFDRALSDLDPDLGDLDLDHSYVV